MGPALCWGSLHSGLVTLSSWPDSHTLGLSQLLACLMLFFPIIILKAYS